MLGSPPSEPGLGELARTVLAQARQATLVTAGCPGRASTMTVVTVEEWADGRLLVRLDAASPGVALVATCPVVTVSVPARSPFRALTLTGPLQRVGRPRDGLRAYRLSLLSARLVRAGGRGVPIPLGEFYEATPDPLYADAPAALRHLAEAHGDELLACVRAQGHHRVDAVVPRALDRYGVELALIDRTGVHSVRLVFPHGPVRSIDQVATGLRVLLTCRCHPRTGD